MTARYQDIGFEDFDAAPGFYKSGLDNYPTAFRQLFALLNDPENEGKLVKISRQGNPALGAVVQSIETNSNILIILRNVLEKDLFCRTVGYTIRLKMEKLGWKKTGRKGSVPCSLYFTSKAEIYEEDLDLVIRGKRGHAV